MDINYFKEINDTFGHDYGDTVLKRVAAIIREAFDHNSSSYRIGGDEFSVLCRGSDLKKISHQLKSMTDRLTMERQKDSTLPTLVYGSSASQTDLPDIQDVLKAADAQMYLNKEQQKTKNETPEK
jgi:diguanylate cyclase (GGDEF)-like protein